MENKEAIKKIQDSITEGKEVIINREDRKTEVYVSQNTNDTDGTQKWTLLLDGNEFFSKEVVFGTLASTFSINIKDVGIRHCIHCKAIEVVFKDSIAYVK
jgi:hypothetical protein